METFMLRKKEQSGAKPKLINGTLQKAGFAEVISFRVLLSINWKCGRRPLLIQKPSTGNWVMHKGSALMPCAFFFIMLRGRKIRPGLKTGLKNILPLQINIISEPYSSFLTIAGMILIMQESNRLQKQEYTIQDGFVIRALYIMQNLCWAILW